MTAGNGGSLGTGERLARIEKRLDDIEKGFDDRISRHRKANEEAVSKLAETVVRDFGSRVTTLERNQATDAAVEHALAAAKKEAKSNKRWVIGVGLIGGGGLLVNAIMLINLLSKVR